MLVLILSIEHAHTFRSHRFLVRGGASGGSDGLGFPTIQTNVDTTRVIIETSTSAAISDGAPSLDESEESEETATTDETVGDTANEDSSMVEENADSINNGDASGSAEEPSPEGSVSEQVNALRSKGKRLHDAGEFAKAADCFATGATLLDPAVDEDFFTFKLHQALCCLKMDDNDTARDICTEVLDLETMPILLRARALHRRAKAYLALEDRESALDDARSAAMFGDSKAVELYGKLMRESRGMETTTLGDDDASLSSSFSPDLFESLLSKSRPSPEAADPMASMFDMKNLLGGDSSGLAKSVLSSVSKRLDDDATQEMICGYLQGVEGPQLAQVAGMAGIPLNTDQATRLAKLCQRTTKKGIRKIVKTGRRLFYSARLIRKTFKVIGKYRNILILSSILWWTSSVLSRPLPTKSTGAVKNPKVNHPKATKPATNTVGTKPVGLLKPRR